LSFLIKVVQAGGDLGHRVFRFLWKFAVAAIALLLVFSLANSALLKHQGYYISPEHLFSSQLAVSQITGTKYAVLATDVNDYSLFESNDIFGIIWKLVPGVRLGISYDGYHPGTDVVISPNSRLLFVRRSTRKAWNSPHILLSDVIDIGTDPPQTLVQGPDCCMDGNETEEGLERNHRKVLEIARAAGLNPDP
jgi:hypothetical protein